MQVVVWIVIVLVAILLIWLLRKWIKRLIFIIVLLVLAFFIYGLFNPSGASRLWYNVRTFPARVTSWISDKTFLDYDSYRLDISSVGVIGGDKDSADIDSVRKDTSSVKDSNIDVITNNKGDKENSKNNTIQSFTAITPTTLEADGLKNNVKSDKNEIVTGYSKNDVLGIIGKYIENNLDDDTDILVTVEYENDYDNPNKIVLQTQGKSEGKLHFASIPRLSVKKVFSGLRNSKSNTVKVIAGEAEKVVEDVEKLQEKPVESAKKEVKNTVNNGTYNGLTQSEIKETEEIFSILF